MTVESYSGLHSFLLIFWIFSHLLLFTGEAGGWESAPEQLSHPPASYSEAKYQNLYSEAKYQNLYSETKYQK